MVISRYSVPAAWCAGWLTIAGCRADNTVHLGVEAGERERVYAAGISSFGLPMSFQFGSTVSKCCNHWQSDTTRSS